ncbi:g-type lectin s-receptor-like serine/threonine-protein kinase rlk1 [Phtheirospermum japonicum]|uniref:Receptor-like serine/threonine-protein kinase n=1 Tax=Phtheirospermum japonicum TaxID=374723 RepID=A0A830C895_9LAMI|nr:g-type lectin s-receptor-like serine/threonine-protein kinase rlk1 [Phtheirospermum japonicum]
MAHIPLLLFTALILFPFPTFSQITGNITVGSSITAAESSNPWLSPSGDFAFGFQQLQNNTNLFVLAIWFARIPDRTVVWFERSSYPVPRGSILRLDAANGLVLRDPQGRLLYSTDGLAGQSIAYGYMNDTGNLVLSGSDSTILWQSFDHPADTILPTQMIPIRGMLISRITQTNFSQGRFYARVNGAGDFVLSTKSLASNPDYDDEYYNSQTFALNSSNPGDHLVFNERGSIAVVRRNGDQHIISSRSIPSVSDFYYRATIDFDGVFTQYYFPRDSNGSSRWTAATLWPDNICGTGSGACGYNSICRLQESRPVCECPQGFSLVDSSNPYGDCESNFTVNCIRGGQDEYALLPMDDTVWVNNDYEQINPSTKDECRNACMSDCLCAASIYADERCWKKKLPLSNGRVDTNLGATTFLKIGKGHFPIVNPTQHIIDDKPKNNMLALVLVGSVLLGTSAFINLLFISAACLSFFLIYKKRLWVVNPAREANSATSLRFFSYKELVQATDGFKEEVGRGAFGIVYKGVVSIGGEHVVAVKKLDRVAQDDTEKEFRTEVNVIGQTHHKNLVPLIGFCDQGPHRLLVYEYMSNWTLAGFLFRDMKPSWSQRTQIALGVARGLTYLHEECCTQIIHCDIKPQNILLDEYLNARISDFGLAKLLMMNQSHTLTNIRGTKGYVAPEWFRNKKITVKVDVYSFGVLLLEIVACRKSVEDMEFGGENPILTDWVWDCFVEGRLDALVENDAEALRDGQTFERFVRVGIWCIQEDASLRPTMRRVFQMLEGSFEVGVPPCPYPINSTV